MGFGNKKLKVLYLTVAVLIIVLILFIVFCVRSSRSDAVLHIEPGRSYLYLKNQDLTVQGQDKDGVTYFFLPSFAEMDSFSQDRSAGRALLPDRSLLSDPAYGLVRDVTIELDEGISEPWKIAFFHSENLHTAYIDLKGMSIDDIDHDTYASAGLQLYSPYGKLEYNKDDIQIKGRGNTTWDAVKRPFEIKLPENYPLCDLTSCSKWALLADFYDDTGIQNKMIMDLSREIGMEYAIDSDWIDLYINGEYRGTYLLCKDPGTGKGRLQLNGGYLIEKDIRTDDTSPEPNFSVNNNYFKIKDPLPVDSEGIDNISLLVKDIDRNIHTYSGREQLAHIEVPSFTRRFMTDEFCFRSASMQTNCYFYNRGNTLYAGPCWDYDLSCGKPLSGSYYYDYTKSLLDRIPDDALDWDSLLMQNPEYKAYYDRLFKDSLPVFEDVIERRIDEYADRISASYTMNRALWQNDEFPVRFYSSPENKYRYLKFFLSKRLELLAGLCDYSDPLPAYDFSNSETHKLTFLYDDGTDVTMEVPDGTLLSTEDLPDCGTSGDRIWMYEREEQPFSPYIPVYEDITFVSEMAEDDL